MGCFQIVPKCPLLPSIVPICPRLGPQKGRKRTNGDKPEHVRRIGETPPFRVHSHVALPEIFRNSEKGEFVRGGGCANLRKICFVHQRKGARNCPNKAQIRKSISDNLMQIPLFQCPLLQISEIWCYRCQLNWVRRKWDWTDLAGF